MQKRYFDSGQPYDHNSFTKLFSGILSPGVYKGFDLSLDGLGNLIIGSTHTTENVGVAQLPNGLIVSESYPIALAGVASFTDYTVCCRYVPNGLIGSGSIPVEYFITNTLLSTPPADSTILGWIREDGSLLDVFKLSPLTSNQEFLMRESLEIYPFRPVFEPSDMDLGLAQLEGWDSTYRVAWTGVNNPSTASTLTAIARYQFVVKAAPYSLKVFSKFSSGSSNLVVTIKDTANTSIALLSGLAPYSAFVWKELVLTSGLGTWTVGELATLELTYSVPITQTVKVSRFDVIFWPYPIEQY